MPPTVCPICDHKTMFSGWTGSNCDTCGVNLSEGIYQSGIVRTVREYTKLSRKEIAEKAGLKPSTIKSYEWKRPSKKYFVWFKEFIKQFYEENNGFKKDCKHS